MFIVSIPNRNSKPAILLREGYRENGKVKTRTLANLTGLPPDKIEAMKAALKGTAVLADPIPETSLPHGHVLAVHTMTHRLGLDTLLHGRRHRMRELSLAMIMGRILDPGSKLALAQSLAKASDHSTLGEVLGLGELGKAVDKENKESSQEKRAVGELYSAMDWLLERQEKVENALAKRHLGQGCTVLYDLSSSYFEGHCCSLAQHGYSRDGRGDRPQINYGLLCNEDGIPVAIEVVPGNVGDPKTIPAQVQKLKERFGLDRVVVVGDRGMVTQARIREDISTVGYDWISALRHGAIRSMTEARFIQPSLFDENGLAEITHPDYPGERLIACFNPIMAEEQAQKRELLLQLTEKALQKVREACSRKRNPLEGKDKVGLNAGAVLHKFKVGKYFQIKAEDHDIAFSRREENLARDAAINGIYVIRTSVPIENLSSEKAVLTYKRLAKVERAFRTMKSVDLQVRPIHHHLENRVKAHMFICMLAYYEGPVSASRRRTGQQRSSLLDRREWHLRSAWGELMFADEEGSVRETTVSPVRASASGREKKAKAHNREGLPLQTFHGLIKSLATMSRIQIRMGQDGPTCTRITKPTPLQARALELIDAAAV